MGRLKPPKKINTAQKIARRILCEILQLLFWVMNTLRFKNQLEIERPCVMAVYHDELMPLIHYFRDDDVTAIASQNHFGYSIAKVMERYGYEVALGSRSRGGMDAFFQLLKSARKGKTIAFTVDGSRGPRHEMKQGAVMLARKTKLPLYLIRADYKGLRLESTWDKTKLPKPFTSISFNYERFPMEDYADETDINIVVAEAQKRLLALQPDDYGSAK
ncbi:lysophospholipid acyltransferase family protein [Zhongshania sp.]|uniref:lysophospholipid acyltransferase family protein n=1 Tax=Zhongshania sp. TaxID=1971902 RepID=UPI003567A3E4